MKPPPSVPDSSPSAGRSRAPPPSASRLEDDLSRPTPALRAAMAALHGDLLILGVSGKMGPSLARLAQRASTEAGVARRIVGAARFSEPGVREALDKAGIDTIQCDLFDRAAVDALPTIENIIYMVGRKFGASLRPAEAWATNVVLPARAMERFPDARWVVFSTGNVYPLTPAVGRGSSEGGPVGPVGEYAQSALARERMVEFFSTRQQTRAVLLRLNYACELRYGVLRDIADRVYSGAPIDLTMGWVNVIWQRDANAVALCALAHASVPPLVLNVAGTKVAVRDVATQFGARWGVEPIFTGREADTALLSDGRKCVELFGAPDVSVDTMIKRTADWVAAGGATLNRPTHYGERDGRF